MGYHFNSTQYNIHWKNFSEWSHANQDYVVIGTCGVYVILLFIAIFMLIRFRYNSVLYPSMIITALLFRILFGLMLPLVYEGILLLSPLVFFLYTLPAFFFFTCFMILLFFWGEIYMKASIGKDVTRRIWTLFGITNAIMYTVAMVFFGLDFGLGYWDSWFETSMIIYESTCYIVILVGVPLCFFFYGYYTFRSHYHSKVSSSPRYKQLLRRIGIITLITMGTWLARAIVVFTPLRFPTSSGYGGAAFFVIFEIIPTLILLAAVIEPRRNPKLVDETTALFINSNEKFP